MTKPRKPRYPRKSPWNFKEARKKENVIRSLNAKFKTYEAKPRFDPWVPA